MLFLLLLLPFAIFRFRVQTLGFNGSMSALLAGWLACGMSSFLFFLESKKFSLPRDGFLCAKFCLPLPIVYSNIMYVRK